MVVKFLGDLEWLTKTQKQVATNPAMISSVASDSWRCGAIRVHMYTGYSALGTVCGKVPLKSLSSLYYHLLCGAHIEAIGLGFSGSRAEPSFTPVTVNPTLWKLMVTTIRRSLESYIQRTHIRP